MMSTVNKSDDMDDTCCYDDVEPFDNDRKEVVWMHDEDKYWGNEHDQVIPKKSLLASPKESLESTERN